MTPIDVMTEAVTAGWHALGVMATQATHLSAATNGERAVFALECVALALVITSIGVVVAEGVRLVRIVRQSAPLVWLTVLTQPYAASVVVLFVVTLAVFGLWHWWGSVASVAVAVAAVVVVTDRTMQADYSAPVSTDEGEDS